MSGAAAIGIAGVVKRFATDPPGTPPVLGRVDLSIAPGEFVALVGRSGCGKGSVFRQEARFPWRTALGNVAIAARNRGLPRAGAIGSAR